MLSPRATKLCQQKANDGRDPVMRAQFYNYLPDERARLRQAKDVMRRMIDPVSTQRGMGCNGMRDPWLLTFGRTLSGVE